MHMNDRVRAKEAQRATNAKKAASGRIFRAAAASILIGVLLLWLGFVIADNVNQPTVLGQIAWNLGWIVALPIAGAIGVALFMLRTSKKSH